MNNVIILLWAFSCDFLACTGYIPRAYQCIYVYTRTGPGLTAHACAVVRVAIIADNAILIRFDTPFV